MNIITEGMRYLQRLCEYAIKTDVTKTAKQFHTYRQFVYRQLKKYDGNLKNLALKLTKPFNSLNAHAENELHLIRKIRPHHILHGKTERVKEVIEKKGKFYITEKTSLKFKKFH